MDANWVNVVVGVINIGVTAYVAYIVGRAGKAVVRLEQDRAIKDAWIQIDQTALGNPVDLQLLDAMFHPDQVHEDEESKRRRWLGYMVLNPVEAAWSSAKRGHMPDAAVASSEATMRAFVRDDMLYALLLQVVYGNDFKTRCRELRAEWEASQRAAAVDAQHLAGAEARAAQQPGHCAGDVAGVAQPG